MKRFNLLALLGFFVGLFVFTSCSKSDDDANESGDVSIVGNWNYQRTIIQGQYMSRNVEAILQLKGDNTFSLTVQDRRSLSQGQDTYVERSGSAYQGEYAYVGEKLTLSFKQERSCHYNQDTQMGEWGEWNTYEEVREGTARLSAHELVISVNDFDFQWANFEGDFVTFTR